mmetsp:Transcript_5028/g.12536  ORF Transcript_5028/g.12536 Transcript_5028/m.12536 type:complete len:858 (+) Transcript_5028:197-2770(+)|eukprot:CAMPEP_0177656748 /NCGR_PEP_ID=MMETSP0447-20121125/15761_1 /TAXON_ID=0 /ORGANISM="Stygamoeba regulata, Strain BSH-02190019" /LENGTH=857 /DNA_ID=CAMNT_0019160945 /DNA_START=185 /DNA_END=2758 /DNA_ORIENTATION=+
MVFGVIRKVGTTVNSTLQKVYYKHGELLARFHWIVIIAALLVVGISALGFLRYEENSIPEDNWVPQGTDSVKNKQFLEKHFDDGYRSELTYFTAKDKGDNVLVKGRLLQALDLHDRVIAIQSTYEGKTYSFQDLCYRTSPSGPCEVDSVLAIWNYDEKKLRNDPDVLATINSVRRSIDIDGLLGGVKYENKDDKSSDIKSAEAMRVRYKLDNREIEENGSKEDKRAEEWENNFEDLTRNVKYDDIEVYPLSGVSIRNAFSSAISGDLILFFFGLALLAVYVIIMLGRPSFVHTHILIGMVGLVSTGFAIVFSYGVCLAIGLPINPLVSVLPFILIGIGVDDLFILAGHADRTPISLSVRERMGATMSHAGISITITSLTDFLAFTLSATSRIPAIADFAVYAGIGIIGDFFFQITFWSAFLVLDLYRQHAMRADILPCVRCGSPDEDADAVMARLKRRDFGPMIMYRFYSRAVTSWPGRIVVILLSIALLGTGIYGVTQISTNYDQEVFIPSGSWIWDTLDIRDEYFDTLGPFHYTVTKSNDYFRDQKEIPKLTNAIRDSKWIRVQRDSWYDVYVDWLPKSRFANRLDKDGIISDSEDAFYESVREFLKSNRGRQFEDDVKFKGENEILATRVFAEMVKLDDTEVLTESKDDLEDIVERSRLKAFSWAPTYLAAETVDVVFREVIMNSLLAVCGVFLITLLFLAQPAMAAVATLSVLFSVLVLMGSLHYWDMALDVVVIVVVVISVGLSVDYSVHIVYTFLATDGKDRVERVRLALRITGPSVLNGGISTLIAVIPLAFSQSYVFFTFFRLFLVMILAGIFFGLALTPVILLFIGTAAYPDVYGSQEKMTDQSSSSS